MKIARQSMVFLLLAGILLASCAGQVPSDAATPDINASLTAGVGTLMANFFETMTAAAPPATETPSITPLPLVTNSPIALPTSLAVVASPTPYIVYLTPTPTGTVYTPTVNPASLAYGCNNLAFIQDVSVPAGTVMRPGETFTKEWKVANTGTCTWDWSYRLVFVSGESMSGNSVHPNRDILAGNWTTLRLPLEAPTRAGTYTGYWQLSTTEGNRFGALLSVSIVVARPTNTPAPATHTSTSTNVPANTSTSTATSTPTETPTP